MKASQVVLKHWVEGRAVEASDFEVQDLEVDDALQEGQLLMCELIYLSVDPYMRGLMRDTPGYFLPPFTPGGPISSAGIARVLKAGPTPAPKAEGGQARAEAGGGGQKAWAVGDFLSAFVPWRSPCVVEQGQATRLDLSRGFPLSYYLGALGMPGFTAYAPLKTIGKPQRGETLFVSAAAGAVGQLVGQIAKKAYGCRVVGSAGSEAKVRFLTEKLGFDAAFNYKAPAGVAAALQQHCPDGIDVYYDNVGGATLEAALGCCNQGARVIACGAISQYDTPEQQRHGVKNLFLLVTKRILMQGFIIGDYYKSHPGLHADFQRDMGAWIESGDVIVAEDVVPGGLPAAGDAFSGMMRGDNVGKRVVQVGDDPCRRPG